MKILDKITGVERSAIVAEVKESDYGVIKKLYKELNQQFTEEELVDRYVFPTDQDKSEREEVENEIRALRLKSLRERTEAQRLLSELMKMKLLIKDYLDTGDFIPDFAFPQQLNQYIKVLGLTKKDFAAEIGLHPTQLSRVLNDRENPNVELTYRLEKHCDSIIPAIYWWKLHSKRLEEEIKTNRKKRETESKKVSNSLEFRT